MDKGIDIKRYLEENMDFVTTGCDIKKQSVCYTLKHTPTGASLQYEIAGDSSIQFTMFQETRKLPAPDKLIAVLGHRPTDLEVVRLAAQVVEKLLYKNTADTHTTIKNQFRSYGSR